MFKLRKLELQYPDMMISVDPFELAPAKNEKGVLYVHAPSGFGKTTVLRAIAGLEPCEGEFTGSDLPVHKRNIGFVFQDQLLLSHLNATENVMLGLELRGVPKQEAKSWAQAELEKVGLGHRLESAIRNLSGGERQRVALLRALIIKPSLLLLDEPYRGLDSESKNRMNEYLNAYLGSHPVPVIWVSHENEVGYRLIGEVVKEAALNGKKKDSDVRKFTFRQ